MKNQTKNQKKKKIIRPRPSKYPEMFPIDINGLEELAESTQKKIQRKIEHLKKEPRELRSRNGLKALHTIRAMALMRLYTLSPEHAQKLSEKFKYIIIPKPIETEENS